MSDLRDLLEREARKVSGNPDALQDVRRRAERRHRARRVVAGVTALALVAGVGLGAWTVLRDRGPDIATPAQSNPDDTWPAEAWPHETRQEAEAAQAAVDRGDPAVMWQASIGEIAWRYLETNHQWIEAHYAEDFKRDGADKLTFYASSCDTEHEDPCQGDGVAEGPDQELIVTIERLVRPGEGGVWTVTKVFGPASVDRRVQPAWGRLPGGSQQQCPVTDPVVPGDGEAEVAARAVLTAANSRVPQIRTVWDWLEPETQRQFGPYELFDHHLRSTPAEPYGEWTIESASRDFSLAQDLGRRCGEDVRAAAVAVYVTFPNDPHASEGTGATLIFIGHADGMKLWSV